MIFCEYASPMPGSASRSSLLAVLMSSLPAGFAFSDLSAAFAVCVVADSLLFVCAAVMAGAANTSNAKSAINSLLIFSPVGTDSGDAPPLAQVAHKAEQLVTSRQRQTLRHRRHLSS